MARSLEFARTLAKHLLELARFLTHMLCVGLEMVGLAIFKNIHDLSDESSVRASDRGQTASTVSRGGVLPEQAVRRPVIDDALASADG
jgi:hypothetical protein